MELLERFYETKFGELHYILPLCHKSYHDRNGLFEANLIYMCKNLKWSGNGIFLDVGSHTGTYSINLAKYFKYVYAFEPQRQTFYALCGSISINKFKNILPCNCGLGSEEQTKEDTFLNIISFDGGGSTIKNTLVKPIKKEKICIKTLDEIEQIYNDEKVEFIKCDIEGNELEFLKGAIKTIEKHQPIILIEQNDDKNAIEFLKDKFNYEIKNTDQLNMFLCFPPNKNIDYEI